MSAVNNMRWSLERTRQLFVWLTIFALPWQTRWFQEGPMLGNFPWEQGRISIYVSWFFVLMSVSLALFHRRFSFFRRPCEREDPSANQYVRCHDNVRAFFFLLSAALLLVTCLHTTSMRATFQFCLEIGVLGVWFWSVWDLLIPFSRFAWGLVVSLLPSVLFGLWQYAAQMIPRIKYLGIAAQDPLTRGVSVIEVAGERVLRVYGTFPHPNIFAGWLVIAIVVSLFLIPQMRKSWQRLLLMMGTGLYTVTLVLTFSRAALIALSVSLLACVCVPVWRRLWSTLPWREVVMCIAILISALGITTWWTRELWFVRAQTGTRLERRSVNERAQGLQDGIHILRASPWLGVGPGSELKAIQALYPNNQTPPVPPHLVWLVMLNEIGFIGLLAFIGATASFFHDSYRALSVRALFLRMTLLFPFLVAFGVLSFFDHYLWTLWAGKTLTALGIFMMYRILSEKASIVAALD